MANLALPLLFVVVLSAATLAQSPLETASLNAEERKVARFIERAESELWANTQKHTIVEWAYESNITDHNEKRKLDYQVRLSYTYTMHNTYYVVYIAIFSHIWRKWTRKFHGGNQSSIFTSSKYV